MRTSKAFVLGAIIGATVVWLWGREMEEYVYTKEHVSEALRAAREA